MTTKNMHVAEGSTLIKFFVCMTFSELAMCDVSSGIHPHKPFKLHHEEVWDTTSFKKYLRDPETKKLFMFKPQPEIESATIIDENIAQGRNNWVGYYEVPTILPEDKGTKIEDYPVFM